MEEENLVDLLSNLHLDDNRRSTLLHLNGILSKPTINSNEFESICRNVGFFRPLFDCLNSSDRKEIELVCSLLEKIFLTISPLFIIENYENELNRGISHPNPTVKQLTLKELCRVMKAVGTNSFVSHQDLVEQIVPLIADDNEDVFKRCAEFLISLASFDDGLDALFSQRIIECFDQVIARGDTVRFRVYDIMVKISQQSEKGFEKCVRSGIISKLVSEVKNDDVLIQLNCLEVISDLSMCPHGMSYLDNNGVIRNLENMLDQAESSSLGSFITPGLLKFFGSVGHLYPKDICCQYPIFMNKVFEALSSNNTYLGIAIETVGVLGSSVEGKMVLEKLGDKMLKCMETLGSVINSGVSDVKIKALNTLESLLNLKESEQTTELIYLTKMWFDSAAKEINGHFFSQVRVPFEDVRLPAMRVFQAIAKLPWGQTYMNDFPGFIEYLLDRSTEGTKNGKELKYELIKVLAESPTTTNTMGNVVLMRLKEYVHDGRFYVSTEVAVAVDGST